MIELKVSEVVLDFDLYPRGQINSQNVSEMVHAEKAGKKFPPILIDTKSKRVVDGFHRVRKQQIVYGPDATIEAVAKDYSTDPKTAEAEMLLDSVELNAVHGQKLNSCDRMRVVFLAGKLGIEDTTIAGALSTTVDQIDKLRVSKSAQAGALRIPIKNTIRHMAGRKLTKPQVEANRKLGGMNQLFYINQVITLLKAGLVNWQQKGVQQRLEVLLGLLEKELTSIGKTA